MLNEEKIQRKEGWLAMNKYEWNIGMLLLIMISYVTVFTYWFNLPVGSGQLIVILSGGYGIYQNLKARGRGRINHM